MNGKIGHTGKKQNNHDFHGYIVYEKKVFSCATLIALWNHLHKIIVRIVLFQGLDNERHSTHLSLASLLLYSGKQHSLRRDAAERGVPSGAILFAYRIFIENLNKI